MNLDNIQYDPDTGEISAKDCNLKYHHKNGYLYVIVNKRKCPVHLLIHDLLGIDRTGLVVVHLDENKLNNRADNLMLMTRQECNEYYFDKRQQKKSHS